MPPKKEATAEAFVGRQVWCKAATVEKYATKKAKTLQCHGFWGLASRIPRQLFHTTGNSFATHRYSKMIRLNPTFFNIGKYLFLLVNLSKTNAPMIK